MEKARKSSDYIYTQSGRRFLPEEIKADDIVLEDIAFGLSRIFRFNGQSKVSVLRHSIGMASCFKVPAYKYLALFHDAAEAYLMDVPVPLKRFVSKDWHEQYQRIEGLIFSKFGVPHRGIAAIEVSQLDKRIVEYEMEAEDTSMKYPDAYKMPYAIKEELRAGYRWDLHDRFLPSLWIDLVHEFALSEGYFAPQLSLE